MLGGKHNHPPQNLAHDFPPKDALEAYDRGLAGVVLSNHGGRQLDFARSGIEVLVEVTTELRARRGLNFPNEKFQLFVDGGVRRATDVIKAIALGATAGRGSKPCSVGKELTRTISWYWPTIPLRFLVIWVRRCRPRIEHPPR